MGVAAKLKALLEGVPARSATNADKRFAVLFGFCLAAFCGGFLLYYYARAGGLVDHTGHLIGRDFVVYWTASVLTLKGQVAQVFHPGLFHAAEESLAGTSLPLHPWVYPPHALFFSLPLGLLTYLWSYVLWLAVTLALYLAASLGGRWTWSQALYLALAPATFVNVLAGQNGFLTAALLIGGLRLLEKRPGLAGILLGLLCFKPQLGVLIPVALVAARLWRPFWSAALTVTALVALSIAAFGLESWQSYLGQITTHQSVLIEHGTGLFVLMMPTPMTAARILDLGHVAGYGAQTLFSLCAIAGVYLAFRRPAERRLQIAVLLAGALLVVPYGFNYDMTVTSVAVLWGFERAAKTGFLPGEKLVLALAWALPVLVLGFNAQGLPLGPLVLGLLFLVLLIRANGWLPKRPLTPSMPEAKGAALPQPSDSRA